VYNEVNDNLKVGVNMVEQNYEYFKNNFENLYSLYNGKYIVLKNLDVIGVYDSFARAVKETAKTEELGTFAVQHCVRITPNNANKFYNDNVRFAALEGELNA
jgi:hypothetical protein